MAKVNVGHRTTAEDAAALDAFIKSETSVSGKKVVERADGQKFIVEKAASGITIHTRIA